MRSRNELYIIRKRDFDCGRNELSLKFQQVTLMFFKAWWAWTYRQSQLSEIKKIWKLPQDVLIIND